MSVASVRRALGVYHPRRIAYKGALWGRLYAERWTLATRQRVAGGPGPARRGRILTYHSIGTRRCGVNDVRPRDFERHLQAAVDDGWSFTTPAEVIAEPDKPQLALTFDDGMASHSVTHSDFGRLAPGEARRELEVSRERLREVLGVETSEFAIPFGQSGNWTREAGLTAAEAGYRTVYAQCVGTRPEGTVARTFITRIDRPALFRAALAGAYDNWEEWY